MPLSLTPRGPYVGLRGAAFSLLLCSLLSCKGEPSLRPFDGYDPASTFGPGTQAPSATGACTQVTGESLRARKAALVAGGTGASTGNTITVERARLWVEFKETCGSGSCHAAKDGSTPKPDAKSPAIFTLSENTFHLRKDLGTSGLARILAPNADLVMPPASTGGAERRPDDPIRLLGEKLLAWEEAGFPETFQVQTKQPLPSGGPTSDPYVLSSTLGENLTNIGSCLPSARLEKQTDQAQRLDALFAEANTIEDLPETLAETDLVSLDSEVLSRLAVYSYAPTYTLFSDHASKMRYVRVPMGKKVTYNPATKDFDIPPNTRFYKTFLRKVTDKAGDVGYRKMETRLIVSRPDKKLADGSFQVTSLMVVYAWDNDEKMARKVTDPLLSQEPWSDRLCPYVVDEREPRTQKDNPISPGINTTKCTYMTSDELTNMASGKIRHYAIPSQERCVQCHMGSNNHSFILGFTPWQVDRRKAGEGGTYEPPSEDELGQLQRLIDYGVIEGIAPGEAKLEESQGDRKPRNDHELVAQGYMMGNCAFCHSPTGFPTVQNPVLKDFDLFPSASGGAFQFPLEKYSPRAKLGKAQRLRFPYITPALGDFTLDDTAGGDSVPSERLKQMLPIGPEVYPTNDWLPPIGAADDPAAYNDHRQFVEEFDPIKATFHFVGPWRSLIWRNVATPFTYEEDNTIFIHMPRNVPGFDCRAKTIMAEWMLSIPSVPKLFVAATKDPTTGEVLVPERLSYSLDPNGFEQPFAEVKPGDLPYANADINTLEPFRSKDVLPSYKGRLYDYEAAVLHANRRVENYRRSLTGASCVNEDDIVDPHVINDPKIIAPVDDGTLGESKRLNPAAQGTFFDAVPDHAHWVPVDTTDAPGPWVPRRKNWKEVLVDRNPAIEVSPKVKRAIDEIRNLYLTPERAKFSNELVPMGRWHPNCRTSPTVAAYRSIDQLRREESSAGPKPGYRWLFDRENSGKALFTTPEELKAPVHEQSRGEAVFRAICLNCHGKDIDSRSPLASTILELSAGKTRVANFRDGIFGPVSAPGQHAEQVFSTAGGGGTAADWQARYMVFMGLGGTESLIPPIAIKLVSTSGFYGSPASTGESITDANMLESARSVCRDVAESNWTINRFADEKNKMVPLLSNANSGDVKFIRGTGHFELWADICGYQNIPLVRVLTRAVPGAGFNYPMFEFSGKSVTTYSARDRLGNWFYPPNHPVGTFDGSVEKGIKPSNKFPWCVAVSDGADQKATAIKHFRDSGIEAEADMPFCPPSLLTKAFGRPIHQVAPEPFSPDVLDDWTRTGAINAGVAAFYYMDGVTKGKLKPQPAYDECSK